LSKIYGEAALLKWNILARRPKLYIVPKQQGKGG